MIDTILKRLKNPGTLVAVASAIVLLVKELGIDVDLGRMDIIIDLVCTIGISLGVLNNPDEPGIF